MRDNKRGTIEDPAATVALRRAMQARRDATSKADPRRTGSPVREV